MFPHRLIGLPSQAFKRNQPFAAAFNWSLALRRRFQKLFDKARALPGTPPRGSRFAQPAVDMQAILENVAVLMDRAVADPTNGPGLLAELRGMTGELVAHIDDAVAMVERRRRKDAEAREVTEAAPQ